jgi:hypothetical protein
MGDHQNVNLFIPAFKKEGLGVIGRGFETTLELD